MSKFPISLDDVHTAISEKGHRWGASADEAFLISASEPGEFQLAFEQRRPWEADRPAHQSLVLTLRVR